MGKIEGLKKDALPEGLSTPGITRHLAFKGDGFQVVRSRVEPGRVSDWHRHEDYDVYGYVVSGAIRFESGPEGKDVVSIGRGDFFHVPPHTTHRESNPSPDEGQEVILFLQGTGPLVVNVEGPEEA
jgi:quercetin dioxygenase-like cupin family protein